MDIGIKIKQLRLLAGMTQEQLAAKVGVSPQSVSKWETAVTMPDITLLPILAGELGVSIDDLFDLTTEQKLHRIERRMDIEEEFSPQAFMEFENFLKTSLEDAPDKTRIHSLLAHLYHHRMESDSRKVSYYARKAILAKPENKDCQWLLQKAEGANCWDWNICNHSAVIDFYKDVIAADTITPQTPMPYYEVMDNLIADHRTKEAGEYLAIYQTLPAHKPFLVPVYQAYIALADYDEQKADGIMEEAELRFSEESGFLFEKAQYLARKCDYKNAIVYYERSWSSEKAPRYTDALHGIAIIYEILGNKEKAIETYDRMIRCIKEEWNYSDADAAVIEVERHRTRLLKQLP